MVKFEIYEENDQKWHWRLIDDGDSKNIFAKNEKPFLEKDDIIAAIKEIRAKTTPLCPKIMDDADSDKQDSYRFIFWKDTKDNKWYWKLLAADNNKCIAFSAVGFVDEYSIKQAIENVIEKIGCAVIGWEKDTDDPTKGSKDDEDNSGTKTTGAVGS